MVTRGVGPMNIDLAQANEPSVLVFALPLNPLVASVYESGIAVGLSRAARATDGTRATGAKTSNYLGSVLALHEVKQRGCQEALILGPSGEVIEGAFRVLDEFEQVSERTEAMKALQLEPSEEIAFATAALALRFGERGVEATGGHRPAPVTAEQLIEARRPEDIGHSLWTIFQRVQENVMRGGQPGRSVQGRRLQTRPVGSIDRGVSLNRALWMLAEEMRKLKG